MLIEPRVHTASDRNLPFRRRSYGAWICLWVLLLSGCTPQLRRLLLDSRTPPPPTHRVRRDLLREIDALKSQLAQARALEQSVAGGRSGAPEGPLPIEAARTWEDALALLPKTETGLPDWVVALDRRVIAPRAAQDPSVPQQPVLELNIEFASAGKPLFVARFPHAPHTRFLTCWTCHPGIFPLKRGADPTVITMASIQAGQYCGACHGKVAFGVEDSCHRCHPALKAKSGWTSPEPAHPAESVRRFDALSTLLPRRPAGELDWVAALTSGAITPGAGPDAVEDEPVMSYDIERIPQGQPLFKAVFPHEAHTKWLTCINCHPGIFEMKKGANPITMEKILQGEYCGRCHGKVAFGVASNCDRCHPGLRTGT